MTEHFDKFDKNGKPIKLMEWARLFEDGNYKRIALTELPNNVRVSTVWLGLDHSFDGDKLLIFETMVFGGKHDGDQDRYTTLEEAQKGHKDMVKRIKTKD